MSEETEEGSKMGGGVAGGMRRKEEAMVACEYKQ